ncbi:hypothetical protein HK097_010028 [Rhizophlyctis rosea]|uniref:Uncharacterized protein n=1 Tax=Rhizophlyctis rosea TaxID=64517 RepID=A0AAD5SKL9_9FUNG|nr:hypothetical protein HK097_010028 [Rhizophlyctis rosea]
MDSNQPNLVSAIDTPTRVCHPPTLRMLASKHINWTRILYKFPQTAFPRIHELYDEYLEVLKQAHKRRLMRCMNEAFHHNLPVDHLCRIIPPFLATAEDSSKWKEIDYMDMRIAVHFAHLSEACRKVIRATVATYSFRDNARTRTLLLVKLTAQMALWYRNEMELSDAQSRVVDRVGKFQIDQDEPVVPLIVQLAVDRWMRNTLDDYVKLWSMLPAEGVVDRCFPFQIIL